MTKNIHGVEVGGINVDFETRCAHYHSKVDIIAIKFKCCERWFSCFECHAEMTKHAPQVWNFDEYATPAVLCGACGQQLTITDYLESASICPQCRRTFNPGCARHYHLYFESLPSRLCASD